MVSITRRKRFGEMHYAAKLTDHEVEIVRQLHDEGLSYLEIAKKFGVSKPSIQRICTHRTRNGPRRD